MSSLHHSQQTNRHLGARLSRIEKATKLRYQEIRHILRVEFTLTKFKEENLEPGVGDKLLLLTKLLATKHYKVSNLGSKMGPAN